MGGCKRSENPSVFKIVSLSAPMGQRGERIEIEFNMYGLLRLFWKAFVLDQQLTP
jgi:hypothetical protein